MLFISQDLTESGMKIPEEQDQTDQHKKMFELSDRLVMELKESDVIIISVPIYNFGPPATLKSLGRPSSSYRVKILHLST